MEKALLLIKRAKYGLQSFVFEKDAPCKMESAISIQI